MKKINSNLARFIVTMIAVLSSLPILIKTLSGSIDDSWQFAIHQAKLNGLVFGKDIVFTYGPLGYLTCPIYIDRGLWLHTLLYTMVTHLLFWGAVYYFLKRCRAGLWDTFYAAAAIVVAAQGILEEYGRPSESYNYFYLFLFAYGYIIKKEKNIPLLAVIALIAALFCYVKFSFAIAVCFMFITFIALLALEKRYKEAVFALTLYLAFAVVSGLILIGGVGAIAAFFYNSWAIADGYVDAMAVDGPGWKFFAAIFAWMAYGAFLFRSIIRNNHNDIYYLSLSIGLLFISYKHSVGNGSMFEWDFFATWGMVFTLYYIKKADETDITDKEHGIKYAALAASILLVALPLYEFHPKAASIKHTLIFKRSQIEIAVGFIRDKSPSVPYEMSRQRLSAYYALSPSTLELLKGHTVDIFTVDAVLSWYYGLNWHPRPIFQSYSAYTAYLDQLNERFLSKPGAPEFLLFASVGFDKKSAVLFEPATYRKILTDYSVADKDGIFWVLKRRDNIEPVVQEAVASVSAPLGGKIPFNVYDQYYMFARVYVRYNIIGEIIRVLYRAPSIYIQFYSDGVPAIRYKFCFNAVDGISLNPFVNNAAADSVNEFAITTPYPGFFDKNIRVEFFKVLRQ
ncbi:hypothetical protein [Candidatus Magnetominusculus dajiuhuensis]|uniref:hypothetical protein n=1 Tax=Candidatus Magnetominusculus dajiuhuensis TaxID=3137712 RepID=UPI003B42EC66